MTGTSEPVTIRTLSAYGRGRLIAAKGFPLKRLQKMGLALPKLDLTVFSSSRDLMKLCERRLVKRDPSESAADQATLYLLDSDLNDWDKPASWDVRTGFSTREFDNELASAGLRGFYHHDSPSWQFYDPDARVGVHALPGPMGIPPWEFGSPLRLFLHWAYAHQNLRLTHAATLGINGRGALIVGPSGSGKSGTTLAGLMNGLSSAGDDYVVIEQDQSIRAHAVFRVFKQDADGLRRLGLDAKSAGATELNWHGKYEFDAMNLKPGAFAKRLPIDAILLPEITGQSKTRISAVSPKHAALALAPSAVFQLPGDTSTGFQFFAKLARKLPAYRLHLSVDPSEIAEAVAKHLSLEVAHAS